MPFGMDPSTYKLNMRNEDGDVPPIYYIAVHGYLPGEYVLRFEAAPASAPQFMLSTVEYYHLTPALRHLHCGDNQYAVYGLPPSSDPGFSYFAVQSGERPLNMTTMHDELHEKVFAFALDVSLTINGVTTVLFDQDLSTCKMNFSHGRVWYNGAGQQVENTEQPFLLQYVHSRFLRMRDYRSISIYLFLPHLCSIMPPLASRTYARRSLGPPGATMTPSRRRTRVYLA